MLSFCIGAGIAISNYILPQRIVDNTSRSFTLHPEGQFDFPRAQPEGNHEGPRVVRCNKGRIGPIR